jgi:uncharacterized FlgJ-related protein
LEVLSSNIKYKNLSLNFRNTIDKNILNSCLNNEYKIYNDIEYRKDISVNTINSFITDSLKKIQQNIVTSIFICYIFIRQVIKF